MSKIDELIQQYCPNGVEYRSLGELGHFYGGLTGKSKEDFVGGNARYISYKNVYSNLSTRLDLNDYVKVLPSEKQNKLEFGDVLFTGSSETPDECGFSSVITKAPKENIYLNSFCFCFRLYDKSTFLPGFLKYIFRTVKYRKMIARTASGVTRFNVSKAKMSKITLPIIPIEVQSEIVKVLDNFAELTAELTARRNQYKSYKNKLFSFGPNEVEWKKMGEIGTFIRGNGLQKKDFIESGIGCIHYGQIYTYYGTIATHTKSFISQDLASKLKKAKYGDLIFTTTSENVEDVCKAVAWLGEKEIAIGGHSTVFRHQQNSKYLAYLSQTDLFFKIKKRAAIGTKVIDVSATKMSDFLIPIPSLEKQQQIVSILDKFEAYCNDITLGLPAEIATRQKQYEYYREKLYTFKEMV